ncbi:unnamed protein product [Orchesella dallaii]|uniref:Uncharacterized protein n=1 Tax=Orchesella dallaii TaxID=48710 RepID=A0ABP1QY07_9HEXA
MGRIPLSGLTLVVFVTLSTYLEHVNGVPFPVQPGPGPGVLPGHIPPHLATHPALSSTINGKESQLLQYGYNSQNRRGPSPSPLVLQNNQERNLQFANQVSQQRNGRPFLPSSAQAYGQGQGHGHQHGAENPEARALELINKYKGGGDQGQSSYNNPGPLTHQHSHGSFPQQGQSSYPSHSHSGYSPQGLPGSAGNDNESEDIRRLKSLLNVQGRPGAQGTPAPGYGSGGSQQVNPNIGLTSQRGVINPGQYPPQQHSHDHAHHDHAHGHPPQQQYPSPSPYPVTAQSQNSLGQLQFGQTPRSYSGYPGSAGPTSSPGQGVHVPYGSGNQYSSNPHDHSHHHHGQDARTLIQNHASPSENYQPLVYIDPVRQPSSINQNIQPGQSVFVLPASDYKSDDFQRLLNRPAEILIDVVPVEGREKGSDISVHNFSLLLTPSTYARCAQATHSKGYGGKCKLILKAGKAKGPFGGSPQPVTVSYK